MKLLVSVQQVQMQCNVHAQSLGTCLTSRDLSDQELYCKNTSGNFVCKFVLQYFGLCPIDARLMNKI